MKAIILAAGYAMRLYPITKHMPKPLLPVAGKPILEYLLDNISAVEGIDEAVVVTNQKFARHFEIWAERLESAKAYRMKITVVNDRTTCDEDRLGSLGDTIFAIENAGIDDDILLIGGDNLFEDDLNPMMRLFLDKGSSVVAFNDIKDLELAKKFGIGALDNDGRIKEFVEKPSDPKSTFAATFIYFIRKQDIPMINECLDSAKGKREVKAGELIAHMIKKVPVHGYIFEKTWFDIGGIEQYEAANEKYSR